ncbi:uncharacterized protein MELLADRAFT_107009 [Melampsora larici-populina 98AG31]|uniref:Uncharacterized protein n=1 Tax=Melampsora larici-populina (strain 98AG31 / pathotype 3-4-7) TaxID=747676 RepID=F4RND0_MELLP|nr:uncharacterized protein MELLADRAFT_107009 [Melampsora larici-populina 98AG31]EGG05968.1 hypothetical protein MELLADRAFT_107009 [Melampsora larici-populina 98AG31]
MGLPSLFNRSQSTSNITPPPSQSRILQPSLNLHHPLRARSATLVTITNQPLTRSSKSALPKSQKKKASSIPRPKTSRGLQDGNKENIDPNNPQLQDGMFGNYRHQTLHYQMLAAYLLPSSSDNHPNSKPESLNVIDGSLPIISPRASCSQKEHSSMLQVEQTPPFKLAPARNPNSSVSSSISSVGATSMFSINSTSSFSTTATTVQSCEITPKANFHPNVSCLETYLGPSIRNELVDDDSWLLTGVIHSPASHTGISYMKSLDYKTRNLKGLKIDTVAESDSSLPTMKDFKMHEVEPEAENTIQFVESKVHSPGGVWTAGSPYQAFLTPPLVSTPSSPFQFHNLE